ncbi:MAG: DUF2304 domain-containing protein [Patescibacteria group bacterium]
MSVFQVTAMLFALFMLYVVFLHQKRKVLGSTEASFWYSLWALFIILSLFPDLLEGITHLLSFERVFDVLVVSGMMVLTVIIFLTYFNQKSATKRFEESIRKIALEEKRKR